MQISLSKSNTSPYVIYQITLVESFLDKLSDFLVDPLVAGGAPRDWFFNNVARDIDIFIRNDESTLEELTKDINKVLGVQSELILSANLDKSYRSDALNGVINITYGNSKFQLIIVKPEITDVLHTFPCSISKISYEDGVIYPTAVFFKSVRNAALYFTPSCSEEYKSKIKNYFSHYVDFSITFFEDASTSVGTQQVPLPLEALF